MRQVDSYKLRVQSLENERDTFHAQVVHEKEVNSRLMSQLRLLEAVLSRALPVGDKESSARLGSAPASLGSGGESSTCESPCDSDGSSDTDRSSDFCTTSPKGVVLFAFFFTIFMFSGSNPALSSGYLTSSLTQAFDAHDMLPWGQLEGMNGVPVSSLLQQPAHPPAPPRVMAGSRDTNSRDASGGNKSRKHFSVAGLSTVTTPMGRLPRLSCSTVGLLAPHLLSLHSSALQAFPWTHMQLAQVLGVSGHCAWGNGVMFYMLVCVLCEMCVRMYFVVGLYSPVRRICGCAPPGTQGLHKATPPSPLHPPTPHTFCADGNCQCARLCASLTNGLGWLVENEALDSRC